MGSKNNPGEFDCYDDAEPDEPMFVLLGRDRHAPAVVEFWARLRDEEGGTEETKIREALKCANDMREWQKRRT